MKPTRSANGGWQAPKLATSPQLTNAMEVAIAGAAEVSRVGRRIMQRIWDPEPVNNRSTNEPVWCLGCSYKLDNTKASGWRTPPVDVAEGPSSDKQTSQSSALAGALDTPPDSSSSLESSLAYEEPSQDSGWPPDFLDDFESRIWMTYRNNFESIPRSTDPRASSALSFSMRLKTSFGDQHGFSSDTGWGCMIRSGQSLLANAISITSLGRGMSTSTKLRFKAMSLGAWKLTIYKSGGDLWIQMLSEPYCHNSPTILALPTLSTTL